MASVNQNFHNSSQRVRGSGIYRPKPPQHSSQRVPGSGVYRPKPPQHNKSFRSVVSLDRNLHNTAAKEFQAVVSMDQNLHNTAAKEFKAVLYRNPHPYNTAAKEFKAVLYRNPHPYNTAAEEFKAVLYRNPHPYNTAAKEFKAVLYRNPHPYNTAAKEFKAVLYRNPHPYNTAAEEFKAVLYRNPHPYNTAAEEFRCSGVFSQPQSATPEDWFLSPRREAMVEGLKEQCGPRGGWRSTGESWTRRRDAVAALSSPVRKTSNRTLNRSFTIASLCMPASVAALFPNSKHWFTTSFLPGGRCRKAVLAVCPLPCRECQRRVLGSEQWSGCSFTKWSSKLACLLRGFHYTSTSYCSSVLSQQIQLVNWCMLVWCTQNLRRDGSGFTWHQPYNNPIALSVQTFGGQ